MVYTDLLFLFAFLPITAVIIMILGEAWEKNLAITLASLLFIVWARPIYYVLIILPVIVVYCAARLYEKTKSRFAYASASLTAFLFGGGLALASGMGNSLSAMVCSAGFLLFSLRAFMYLDDVKRGESAEKDFLALCTYLISYEFILISSLKSYKELSEGIKSRKFKLSNMAVGTKSFVIGLSKVAILAFAFDRVRLASLHSEVTPWVNVIVGLLATVAEVYIVLDGYTQMSAGLSAINGVVIARQGVSVIPRLAIYDHICDVYGDLSRSVSRHFGKDAFTNLLGLTASSLVAGSALALGNGSVAFVSLVLATLIICSAPSLGVIRSQDGPASIFIKEQKPGVFENVIGSMLTAVGLLFLACGSFDGVKAMFASLNPNNYDFDISYALYDELTRAIPWLVIGLVSISPAPKMFLSAVRAKMSENGRFYSFARVAGTCICVVLLALSVIALVSAGR